MLSQLTALHSRPMLLDLPADARAVRRHPCLHPGQPLPTEIAMALHVRVSASRRLCPVILAAPLWAT